MYMNQENKNKIAIIGHTKGIGRAIADLYKSKNYEVIGLSRSNGYDLITDQEKIMEQIEGCGFVVINAHAGIFTSCLDTPYLKGYVFCSWAGMGLDIF